MKKILVFDMDGTIADLYGVDDWLHMLRKSDTTPYRIAPPIYKMNELNSLLVAFKKIGYLIAVTTWLSKGATAEYDRQVAIVKKRWLDKYKFPYDEFHAVAYGTEKSDCTRHHGGFQTLIDDNPDVRQSWELGITVDASKNIIPVLREMLKNEIRG